jgi:hypothetical protein
MFYAARIGLAVLSVVATSVGDWSVSLRGPCPRCMTSTTERANAPVPIPQRAIVYSFTGEFATETSWWLIDLDTGQVTLRRTTSQSSTTTEPNMLDPAKLENLRRVAVRAWRARFSMRLPAMAPGTSIDAYVVSGGRMVDFNPLERRDDFITKAVQGVTSGN